MDGEVQCGQTVQESVEAQVEKPKRMYKPQVWR